MTGRVVGPTDDDELEARLSAAANRFDGPPASLRAANRALFSWRDPDAELATLVADSRQLTEVVRGTPDSVLLRFAAGGRSITIEITAEGRDLHRLVGQLEPGQSGRVSIRRTGGVSVVDCDELGRFEAGDLGRGPLSIRWAPITGDAEPIETPWLLV